MSLRQIRHRFRIQLGQPAPACCTCVSVVSIWIRYEVVQEVDQRGDAANAILVTQPSDRELWE